MKFSIHHLTVSLIIGLSLFILFQKSGINKKIETNRAALIKVQENNKNLSDSILFYKVELKKFEIRNQLIQAQRDSLLISMQRNNTKDLHDLQIIKKKQAELNNLLKDLRKKNYVFN